MSETVKHANVIEALCGVTAELDAIEKKGSGNTRGRRAEDIYNAIHPLLPKHGVLILPHRVDSERVEAPDTKPGWYDERGKVTFRAYGPGGLEDFIEFESTAVGRDNSDKSSGKFMTYAFKSAVGILLSIPTDATIDNEDHTNAEAIETDDRLNDRKTKVLDALGELGSKADELKAQFKAEGITFSKANAAQVERMEALIREAQRAPVVEAAKARVEQAEAAAQAKIEEAIKDPSPETVAAAAEAGDEMNAAALEARKVAFLAGLGELEDIYAADVKDSLKKAGVVFSEATAEQVTLMERLLKEMQVALEQDAAAATDAPPAEPAQTYTEEEQAPFQMPDSELVYLVLTGGKVDDATPAQTAACVKVIQQLRLGKVVRVDDKLFDANGEALGLLEVRDEAA